MSLNFLKYTANRGIGSFELFVSVEGMTSMQPDSRCRRTAILLINSVYLFESSNEKIPQFSSDWGNQKLLTVGSRT